MDQAKYVAKGFVVTHVHKNQLEGPSLALLELQKRTSIRLVKVSEWLLPGSSSRRKVETSRSSQLCSFLACSLTCHQIYSSKPVSS